MNNRMPAMRKLSLFFLTVLLLAAAGTALAATALHVHDGDTFRINAGKVRLFGVDAPEVGQPGCAASRDALRELVYGKDVTTLRKGDSFGRMVAIVKVGETDVGYELVRQGMAVVDDRYTKRKDYMTAQLKAKKARVGVWSSPNFIEPRVWRRVNSSRGKTCT